MTNVQKLQAQLGAYRNCQSATERAAFLQAQRDRIAQLSAEEAKAEVKAIADKVDEIARKVAGLDKSNAA